MTLIKRLHFVAGFSGVIIFLLTGQYMHQQHDHLQGMPNDVRMLFRSAHIYFLLASIINLTAGLYWFQFPQRHKVILQYIASAFLLVAPFFLLLGFFTEPHMTDLVRPYSRIGLYALFGAGVVLSYLGFAKTNLKSAE